MDMKINEVFSKFKIFLDLTNNTEQPMKDLSPLSSPINDDISTFTSDSTEDLPPPGFNQDNSGSRTIPGDGQSIQQQPPVVVIPFTTPTPVVVQQSTTIKPSMNISQIIQEALKEERKGFLKEIQNKDESNAKTRDEADDTMVTQQESTTNENAIQQQEVAATTVEPPQNIEIFIQQPTPTAEAVTTHAVNRKVHEQKETNQEQESAQKNEDPLFGESNDVFSEGQTRLNRTRSKGKTVKTKQNDIGKSSQSSKSDLVEEIRKLQESENEKLESRINSQLQQVLKSTQESVKNVTRPLRVTSITTTSKPGISKSDESGKNLVLEELKSVVKNLTKGKNILVFYQQKNKYVSAKTILVIITGRQRKTQL